MPALTPNSDSLIVITGLTGYIASHIGLCALRSGYLVRGTVRSRARGEELREAYSKLGVDASPERLSFAIVADLTSEAQFERALEGAEGVVHTALPEPSPNWVKDVIGSNYALLGAARKAGTVKRVVLTSSSTAVYSGQVQPTDKALTEKDWNDTAVEKFQNGPVEEKTKWEYAAAKTLAEKAAWEFMKTNKPEFDLVAVLPNVTIGPVIFGEPRSTAAFLLKLLKGDDSDARRMGPQWYIDVRDNAALHVLSLSDATLGGQRLWAAAGPCGLNAYLEVFRKDFPTCQVPQNVDGSQGESSKQKIDSEKGREMLGGTWRSLEESLVDMAKSTGY